MRSPWYIYQRTVGLIKYIRQETFTELITSSSKSSGETTVENSDAAHSTKYLKSSRQKNVDTQTQINNRPTSEENNLSRVYSRNPRTPVQSDEISITFPSNSCIK